MSLLIKNGEIVTASERYVADIFCENESITRIDRNIAPPPDAEVIDATGKFVFPGFIDPHVHIYLPFMGTFSKDTYETGSKAALVGGTTTLIEMCCPSRKDDALESFDHVGATESKPELRRASQRGKRSSLSLRLAMGGFFSYAFQPIEHTINIRSGYFDASADDVMNAIALYLSAGDEQVSSL